MWGHSAQIWSVFAALPYKRHLYRGPFTAPKVIDFPRYNMNCSEENVILRGIFHVVSSFPLHVMLYRGNLDCFSNSILGNTFLLSLFKKWQGWEFAHSLIAHSLIRSFRSNQMSDCEQFARIAQDKWAIVSESLRSLKTNERLWAICSGCSW